MSKQIDTQDLYITLIALIFIIGILIMRDENKLKIVKADFSDPSFIGLFVVIIVLTIWGLNSSNKRINNAVRHGAIAFLIAYFAHVGLTFVSFFFVGIFVYFTDTGILT